MTNNINSIGAAPSPAISLPQEETLELAKVNHLGNRDFVPQSALADALQHALKSVGPEAEVIQKAASQAIEDQVLIQTNQQNQLLSQVKMYQGPQDE